MDLYKTFKHNLYTNLVRIRYKKLLSKLKEKLGHEKIKVVFYVSENAKWGYQSLFELMLTSSIFEPKVVLYNNLEENTIFFTSQGINTEYAYIENKHISLKKFNPDIVFYEQPWEVPSINKPYKVSKFALCVYVPYGIANNPNALKNCSFFISTLWKNFIAHDCMIEPYSKIVQNAKEIFEVTGHPKLDVYNNYQEVQHTKQTIIYAPHFSVLKSMLGFSTFEWSGRFMLEFAKSHQEINWIFKPHPRLKKHFVDIGYMNTQEINSYFAEWEKIGKVYLNGNYFDLFKNSDGVITDCGSFLIEYFFTKKPLLHLISSHSAPHSRLNRIVSDNYYKIHNKTSLETYLNEIIIKKNDFMKTQRINECNKIFGTNFNSAKRIYDYLLGELSCK